jgi:hypothetical protein
MKRLLLFSVLGFCLALPSMLMAQDYDHGEVGVFAEYMRFYPTTPNINFVGAGGRVGFNMNHNVLLEAEMSYDFERSYTATTSTGGTVTLVRSGLRPLTGLFGPKFQVGTSSAFRAFVTGKVGFINFTNSNASVSAGATDAVNNIATTNTRFAAYPGVGIEGFWGPFGLRLEAGDLIYIANGAHNNVRVSFGPNIRF